MALRVDLPDEVERRVRAAAGKRGVRPEQVVIEAVQLHVDVADREDSENPLAAASDELRQMALDGSLRSEIDAAATDADLAVG